MISIYRSSNVSATHGLTKGYKQIQVLTATFPRLNLLKIGLIIFCISLALIASYSIYSQKILAAKTNPKSSDTSHFSEFSIQNPTNIQSVENTSGSNQNYIDLNLSSKEYKHQNSGNYHKVFSDNHTTVEISIQNEGQDANTDLEINHQSQSQTNNHHQSDEFDWETED